MQLLVAGDEDLPQGAAVVKADNSEAALGVGGGAFFGPIRRTLNVGAFTGIDGTEAEIEEAGLEVEVEEILEVVADRRSDRDVGEAALGVEAVLLEVLVNQGLQYGMSSRRERTAVEQDLAERLGLVGDPGVKRGQEGFAIDEIVLEGQQAEKQALGGVLAVGSGIEMRRRPKAASTAVRGRRGTAGGTPRGEPVRRRLAELALDPQEFLEQEGAAWPGIVTARKSSMSGRSPPAFPVTSKRSAASSIQVRSPVWAGSWRSSLFRERTFRETRDPSSEAGTEDPYA